MRGWRVLTLTVWAIMGGGCLSTPEARIRKHADLFASFPPEVQQEIRQGRVQIGFTADMVRLALGDPHRVYSRTTATTTNEVWVYTRILPEPCRGPCGGTGWYRDRRGRLRPLRTWGWADGHPSREEDVLRLEFDGGRIFAIEVPR